MQNHQSIHIPEGGNFLPLEQQGIQTPFTQENQLLQPPNEDFNDSSVSRHKEPEGSTQHWGKAPCKQTRRYIKRRVAINDKHMVLERPIPKDLLESIANKDSREFTHLRYTACTCFPDDFKWEGYSLRHAEVAPPGSIELFIVLTMYNEDKYMLSRTFHGVVKNIAYLCSRKESKVWGEEGWKKIVVCIVADGRDLVDQSSLAYLTVTGVYQEGIMVDRVENEDVRLHIFEYTTQISIDRDMKFKSFGKDPEVVPIQVIFCLKEEKTFTRFISLRWFFNAFCPILEPNICVLIDVGAEPGPKSIYKLWKVFDIDARVAGAFGELIIMNGKNWMNLLNPVVAAQNFEYKMDSILVKPFESVFGYTSALPGALSAYRYIALLNNKGEMKGPLESYLNLEDRYESIFSANRYLADDRILGFELVTKRNNSWLLRYIKSSQAEIDVPENVIDLMAQRRRWINGSFFSGLNEIMYFYYISRSGHFIGRKIFLYIRMIYQAYNLVFSWFAIGNFYLTFHKLSQDLTAHLALWSPEVGKGIFITSQYICSSLIILQFILASGLGDRHSSSQSFINDTTFMYIILPLASTYGLYLTASLIMFDSWHMFICILQYIIMLPLYVIILNTYAFCNVHDVRIYNWGWSKTVSPTYRYDEVLIPQANEVYQLAIQAIKQKPVDEPKIRSPEQKKEDLRKSFQAKILILWGFSNILLIAIVTNFRLITDYYIGFIFLSVTGFAALKLLGAILYLIELYFINLLSKL
ncbi:Glycosyltransferase Family 2 protein [Gigaspora rosea]|uniref:Chitin synthase n=1 Tax=Gigaspora rosea TaxID=44941 RepID=A0A397UGV7_9GLOM|nr:Glycosyltransferase Family 2 protein [Gigaspora rosea]